ncbi:TrmH family RNA methyltransferase [Myceligenerans xiligouense]|uniref:tRNA G18 (Ribose-2'-O)-methylase SpoU n=1 Tax=Myceligenerans xiligouense TaxID=253184 RepID=A0A3N4YKY0_9MICO|nr:RNA methyltransferase [Myceligenerans xiligouense]RPF21759.1 tRNA G18 (ribose-2'-O)-methylase SpoU [Myceligenerans xiligouense]
MTTSDVVHLDDPADERLADYTRLTDVALRSKHEPAKGLYIAESTQVIHRALEAGHRPRSFLMAPKWLETMADALAACPGVPVYVADEPVLQEITGFHLHRGALAAMHRPPLAPVAEVLAGARGGAGARRSRVAIFEDLVDHTNLGAGFRSAAALGVDAVLVTPRCADPLYRRSVRVSMGTVFQVPWTRIESWPADIALLKEAGYFVAGMTLGEGAITLDELVAQDHPRLALVFGTEGHGMKPATDRLLDARVTIPMLNGVDSLNVATSAAVAFYATR